MGFDQFQWKYFLRLVSFVHFYLITRQDCFSSFILVIRSFSFIQNQDFNVFPTSLQDRRYKIIVSCVNYRQKLFINKCQSISQILTPGQLFKLNLKANSINKKFFINRSQQVQFELQFKQMLVYPYNFQQSPFLH